MLHTLKSSASAAGAVYDISKSGWALRIAPSLGANILKCSFQGEDVLRAAPNDWLNNPDPLAASHFPLAPYSNRIEDGTFEFDGKLHTLIQDPGLQKHMLHGTAWRSPWQVINHREDGIALTNRHGERNGKWPWKFSLCHTIQIKKTGLHLTLSVTNDDEVAMPAGLGFHPDFAGAEHINLQFKADKVWMCDTECLPTHAIDIPKNWDFSDSKSMANIDIDNCFSGLKLPAFLIRKDTGRILKIQGSSNLTHAVVYCHAQSRSACFEPVTHLNNALNKPGGCQDTGIKTLNPGDTHFAEMILTIENP